MKKLSIGKYIKENETTKNKIILLRVDFNVPIRLPPSP